MIGKVIEEINTTMGKLPQYTYEVVLINDCSPDNTFGVIKALAEQYSFIKGINLARNFGQHAALMA
ncbi:MAG: glycosyltransferase, partial [Lachnospiraceae bacterium]|nr:glycosyltransferase [Lachnospiraceae bacterium]